MKVYVLTDSWDRYFTAILGIYLTEEEGRAAGDSQNKPETDLSLEEFEVGATNVARRFIYHWVCPETPKVDSMAQTFTATASRVAWFATSDAIITSTSEYHP